MYLHPTDHLRNDEKKNKALFSKLQRKTKIRT